MSTDTFSNCLAYLEKLPPAISGSGGHNATLRAALACKRFGLSRSDIWEAMQWFNANRCVPQWKEQELRHKVDSVVDMAIKKPLGRGRTTSRRSRVFVAPEPIEQQPDTRPVCEQSEQAEELWWARVAVELGTTLEEFDKACEESDTPQPLETAWLLGARSA